MTKHYFILSSMLLFSTLASGQARTGMSVGFNPNLPYSGSFKPGPGYSLSVSRKLGDRSAMVFDGGGGELVPKDQFVVTGTRFGRTQIDFGYFVFAYKQYTGNHFFLSAGPEIIFSYSDTDLPDVAAGGKLTAGYEMRLSAHNSLEFAVENSVTSKISYYSLGLHGFSGLKVGYVYNFRKL